MHFLLLHRVASFYQSNLERTILYCKLSCNEHHYGHLESDRIYSYWKTLDLSCSHSFRVIFWRDDSIPSGLSASYWRVVGTRYIASSSPVFHFHEYLPHTRVAARASHGRRRSDLCTKIVHRGRIAVNDILHAQLLAIIIRKSPRHRDFPSPRPPRLVN